MTNKKLDYEVLTLYDKDNGKVLKLEKGRADFVPLQEEKNQKKNKWKGNKNSLQLL